MDLNIAKVNRFAKMSAYPHFVIASLLTFRSNLKKFYILGVITSDYQWFI